MPKPAKYRLRREIAIVLIVKLVLIVAIKLSFFSDPVKPGAEGTARILLNSSIAPGVPAHE